MEKIRKKYGTENCVSALNQHCYSTSSSVLNFETLEALGDDHIPRDVFEKVLDMSFKDVEYTIEEEAKLKCVIEKCRSPWESPMPEGYDPRKFKYRMIMANYLVNKVPTGFRGCGNVSVTGYTSFGKSTEVVQDYGAIYKALSKFRLKDGSAKCKIVYFCAESNPIAASRLRKLIGMSMEEYETDVIVVPMDKTTTSDLRLLIFDLHKEKMTNELDYAIQWLTADGTYKWGLAPTLLLIDSVSAMQSSRQVDKVWAGVAKGKDETKQSDFMTALQDKATLIATGGFANKLFEANIYTAWLSHLGDDSGKQIGASTVIYSKNLNGKYGTKKKGTPQGQDYQNDLMLSFADKDDKAESLNGKFGTKDISMVVMPLIQKNRSGKVSKGKVIPRVMAEGGAFDNNLSMVYFMSDIVGLFNFSTKKINGIYDQDGERRPIPSGEGIINLINNPFEMMIVKLNIFKECYLDQFYSSDALAAKHAMNDIINGADNPWSHDLLI